MRQYCLFCPAAHVHGLLQLLLYLPTHCDFLRPEEGFFIESLPLRFAMRFFGDVGERPRGISANMRSLALLTRSRAIVSRALATFMDISFLSLLLLTDRCRRSAAAARVSSSPLPPI